jgi:hypothetical protein
LSVWEGWSVFSLGVLEGLKRDFLEPPKTEAEVDGEAVAEKEARSAEEGRKVEEVPAGGWMSRFKKVQSSSATPATVDANATPSSSGQAKDTDANASSTNRPPPLTYDGGVAASTSALDPQAAASSQVNPPAQQQSRPTASASRGNFSLKTGIRGGSATASASVPPKRRMRAEDMFGDSDEE